MDNTGFGEADDVSTVQLTRTSLEDELERRRSQKAKAQLRLEYYRDPCGWIDDCVYIASKFDDEGDRVRINNLKMTLYPDQRETIGNWIDLERLKATGELEFWNLLIEKSRQIGETWAFASTVAWLLEFTTTRGLFMHTRAAEVQDRGFTVDSFFGRVKYIYDRLDQEHIPYEGDWLFRPFSTDPAAIDNPNGGMVRGECQRDDPGRGSTFDWVIVDECAHVQHGELVHAAIDDACPTGKVYLSTPMGDDNVHARLCDTKPQGWKYLHLHWADHPTYGRGKHVAGEDDDCALCVETNKGTEWTAQNPTVHRYPGKVTSPWYDWAVIGKTNEQVAAELDIDRAGALSARIYPEYHDGTHTLRQGIYFDPALRLETAWDFGLDTTSVILLQDAPEEIRVIGLLEMGDMHGTSATPPEVSAGVVEYMRRIGVPYELTLPEGLRQMRHVGDPAGHARSLESGRPYVDQYRKLGIVIGAPPSRLSSRVDFSISSVKLLLQGKPKRIRVCGVNAREFAAHMRNNTWPMDATGARRIGATQPLDNKHNHACRAFAYWCVATYPPVKTGKALRFTIAEGSI